MLRRRPPDQPAATPEPSELDPVLEVLDACARAFTFPMLDNGYVFLAATRLSAFGDGTDWALVIEVLGYSPRDGVPDLQVSTYASRLHDRDPASAYPTVDAHQSYLRLNPNNESRSFYPIEDGDWIDGEDVATDATEVTVRGTRIQLPGVDGYEAHGIRRTDPRGVRVAEACRYLAATHRSAVLGTDDERRTSVPPGLPELLVLEEWHHPDLINDGLPSRTETFRQLAQVLLSADPTRYRPTEPPNTHWSNWPDGGSL